jgi:hypothetical protein
MGYEKLVHLPYLMTKKGVRAQVNAFFDACHKNGLRPGWESGGYSAYDEKYRLIIVIGWREIETMSIVEIYENIKQEMVLWPFRQ